MAHTHRIATVAALLFVSLPARGQSASVRPDSIRLVGHHYVADLTDGGHAELTLDRAAAVPALQQCVDGGVPGPGAVGEPVAGRPG